MNGLSLSELCCLFCCPPFPARIAAKLAFLPPEPTYSLVPDETGTKYTLSLSERAEWQYSQRELEAIEVFYTRTSRGNRLALHMSSFYLGLGSRINCNIFSYDYSGYGVSTGKPSEKNLYADIDAAWQALRTRYGISPENIILYGQSIGTVPTVDLASRYEVGAVILHSPLIDRLLARARHVRALSARAVEPLWVEGAGHNDVELYGQYLERLKQFVSVELLN
ncbi:hypothetical protein MRX96_010217 [Rhipicephalus microplus]